MRDAFFNRLVEKAKLDKNIVILSADHGAFALKEFELEYPLQYINVGIAEQNMIGVASGLALSGKTVFVYGITPFVSLRVLEQITLDIAAMNLPVNIISVGAGFTYSTDGQSHLGLQDIAAVMTIPGIAILNTSDPTNSADFVDLVINTQKPHYIRIEKEKFSPIERLNPNYLQDGFSILNLSDADSLIISSGAITQTVNSVIKELNIQNKLMPSHIDLHQIKPVPKKELLRFIDKYKKIIVIEENYKSGISSLMASICIDAHWDGEFRSYNVPEVSIFYGSDRDDLRRLYNLDFQSIKEVINLELKI
jgi:transketolase